MSKPHKLPSSYEINTINSSSLVTLTSNEVNQSGGKRREKNAPREGKFTTSDTGTVLHIIKSNLGSGLLAMPFAFHNIGLLMGSVSTVLVGVVCAHCMHILVKSSQELCYQEDRVSLTYSETVEAAFRLGAGGRVKKYSRVMKIVADVFMFIAYYGVNLVYVILVADTAKQVVENHTDFVMNIRLYALLLTVILLPIGIVRHMKLLVPFSAMANVFLLIGCSLTLYLCIRDLPPLSSRPLVVAVTRWPLFFSTAIFGMEGIGTTMPIENAMHYPAHFLGCPGTLTVGMTVVAFAYFFVGSIGYIRFGDEVQGLVTLNLPQDILSESVKVFVALSILFTYPLQLSATVDVFWPMLRHRFSEEHQDRGYYLVRGTLILGTVLIAISLPHLAPVLSLVGALGFNGVGLMLPTVTELATYWDHLKKPFGLTIIKATAILIVWAFATVSGTISSINEIINAFLIT
uniref:Amino acid transporter transmembrane domain-containing protein n=1 Tax=Graphocephala atropunctata TaxID=36148 RepID=A0A1B6LHE4_9HEMI